MSPSFCTIAVSKESQRLAGEGCHELDLLIAKRLHHSAHQDDDADLVCATEQRYAKYTAESASALRLVEGIVGIRQHIRNLDGPAFLQNAIDEAPPSGVLPTGAPAIGVVGRQAVACQMDIYVAFATLH
jgi:hypothetical protein